MSSICAAKVAGAGECSLPKLGLISHQSNTLDKCKLENQPCSPSEIKKSIIPVCTYQGPRKRVGKLQQEKCYFPELQKISNNLEEKSIMRLNHQFSIQFSLKILQMFVPSAQNFVQKIQRIASLTINFSKFYHIFQFKCNRRICKMQIALVEDM